MQSKILQGREYHCWRRDLVHDSSNGTLHPSKRLCQEVCIPELAELSSAQP